MPQSGSFGSLHEVRAHKRHLGCQNNFCVAFNDNYFIYDQSASRRPNNNEFIMIIDWICNYLHF